VTAKVTSSTSYAYSAESTPSHKNTDSNCTSVHDRTRVLYRC